jgi:zinc transporter ZupT
LAFNFLTSSTIFIGIVISLYINDTENIQGVILAISSGFFANIVFSDLLPHKHKKY